MKISHDFSIIGTTVAAPDHIVCDVHETQAAAYRVHTSTEADVHTWTDMCTVCYRDWEASQKSADVTITVCDNCGAENIATTLHHDKWKGASGRDYRLCADCVERLDLEDDDDVILSWNPFDSVDD